MRYLNMPTMLVIGLCCIAGLSCQGSTSPEGTPSHTVSAMGRGGGFQQWGASADLIYGTSVEPEVVDVWKWRSGTMVKSVEFPAEGAIDITPVSGHRYVGTRDPKASRQAWPIVVRRIGDAEDMSRWPPPQGWCVRHIGPSQNGRYAGIVLDEDPGHPSPDYDWEVDRFQIGLIGPQADKIDWITTLENRTGNTYSIRRVRPSDDGAYVALAGWFYGAAVIDVQAKEVLWVKCPKGEAGMVDIAFSPDNKTVYAGGTAGCVFGMDVATGEIVSRWFATQSGKTEYGWRISAIAVSPDGRFVAAGTGPDGVAYVWSRETGQQVKVVRHASSSISALSFSPDSKALATFIPGAIKIWDLPAR